MSYDTDPDRYRVQMKEGNALENQCDSTGPCVPYAVLSAGTTIDKRDDLFRRDGWNRHTFWRRQFRNHHDVRVNLVIRPE